MHEVGADLHHYMIKKLLQNVFTWGFGSETYEEITRRLWSRHEYCWSPSDALGESNCLDHCKRVLIDVISVFNCKPLNTGASTKERWVTSLSRGAAAQLQMQWAARSIRRRVLLHRSKKRLDAFRDPHLPVSFSSSYFLVPHFPHKNVSCRVCSRWSRWSKQCLFFLLSRWWYWLEESIFQVLFQTPSLRRVLHPSLPLLLHTMWLTTLIQRFSNRILVSIWVILIDVSS